MSPKMNRAGQGQHHPAGAGAAPPPPQPPDTHRSTHGKLSAARDAVREFLASELNAREVRITKIAPVGRGEGWRAEALILIPNLEVKMLGLPLTQEVLEQDHFAVELDADMIVTSFNQITEEEE